MTGPELKALRRRLGLTQKDCAYRVHVHITTWQRMEVGTIPIKPQLEELFLIKTGETK